MEPPAKVRITVNLPQSDVETLRTIAQRRGVTITETLRRAIAMEQFIESATADGAKLLLEGKDKSVRELIIR